MTPSNTEFDCDCPPAEGERGKVQPHAEMCTCDSVFEKCKILQMPAEGEPEGVHSAAAAIARIQKYCMERHPKYVCKCKWTVHTIRTLAAQVGEAHGNLDTILDMYRDSYVHRQKAEAECERLRDVLDCAKIRFDIRQADGKPLDQLDIAVGAAIIGIREDKLHRARAEGK